MPDAQTTHKNGIGKPFAKGNPGRPKGAKNRYTQVKEDFFDIWQEVDGKRKLAAYVANNPRALFQFAELIAKLLPAETGSAPAGPAPKFIFNINGVSKEVSTAELLNGR